MVRGAWATKIPYLRIPKSSPKGILLRLIWSHRFHLKALPSWPIKAVWLKTRVWSGGVSRTSKRCLRNEGENYLRTPMKSGGGLYRNRRSVGGGGICADGVCTFVNYALGCAGHGLGSRIWQRRTVFAEMQAKRAKPRINPWSLPKYHQKDIKLRKKWKFVQFAKT